MAETPIAATYVSATSFSVAADKAAEFVAGVRVQADCVADGIKYGTVSSDGTATVVVSLDSGSLTSNLTGVLHGNDDPKSLCNHGHTGPADGGMIDRIPKSILTASGSLITSSAAGTPVELLPGVVGHVVVVGPSGLPVWGQRGPGCYFRDTRFAAKPVTVAADRYCLLSPNRMLVDVGGIYVELEAQQTLDLSLTATWDSVTTDYRVAANRAGKDFYVYAVLVGGIALGLLVSANATYPTGYSTTTSRKIGGFHCLCLSVGTISGHALSGYVTGDIMPGSVWDLMHLPRCSPEGMTFNAGLRLWRDIYGNSYSGGTLVPVFGGTLVDGVSSPAFHWSKACDFLAARGKRLPWYHEFLYFSRGENQGTNISTSADPVVAGAFVDTAGRRMVADDGGEMDNGGMWWWALDTASAGTAAWKNAFDGNDSGVGGQMYMEPNRAIVGGSWSNGAYCGSRALAAANGPLFLSSACGVRGVAEPLAAE